MIAGTGKPNPDVNYNDVPVIFEETLHKQYTGEMDYMSPNIDLSTGTLLVRSKIKNKDRELKSGMYATVTMPLKELKDAVLVKDAAISKDQ